eukprot:m.131095 g.131095  ORF g.131095 m.131095 type:complete len:60 (-) comp15740_c1_seq2:1754-1933(-)
MLTSIDTAPWRWKISQHVQVGLESCADVLLSVFSLIALITSYICSSCCGFLHCKARSQI